MKPNLSPKIKSLFDIHTRKENEVFLILTEIIYFRYIQR
jgi:hypothetical protein